MFQFETWAPGTTGRTERPVCGRYVLEQPDDISERFAAKQIHFDLPSIYNLAPTQELPVVVEGYDGERTIRLMRWGMIPRWQPRPGRGKVTPINARAESVAEKPMFRESIRRRRCLVPVTGFYEWEQDQRSRMPYFVTLKDESLFAFAGIYDEVVRRGSATIASFAVVTTRANDLLAPIDNRMPVILRREYEGRWLSRQITDVDDIEPVMEPLESDRLVVHPVGTRVNYARFDGPDLIKPNPLEQLPLLLAS
jgi:putative SOS response-associated peptidase YedK